MPITKPTIEEEISFFSACKGVKTGTTVTHPILDHAPLAINKIRLCNGKPGSFDDYLLSDHPVLAIIGPNIELSKIE